jgi:hypothetical protein
MHALVARGRWCQQRGRGHRRRSLRPPPGAACNAWSQAVELHPSCSELQHSEKRTSCPKPNISKAARPCRAAQCNQSNRVWTLLCTLCPAVLRLFCGLCAQPSLNSTVRSVPSRAWTLLTVRSALKAVLGLCRFAPIREAEISRSMTTRYFGDLYNNAEVSKQNERAA